MDDKHRHLPSVELVWQHMTLYDDESVRKKLSVMTKWDALFDDARNSDSDAERIETFLELGKSYRIEIRVVETGAA